MPQPIWFDSTETGAPTLNNAAGSLLEVLRSCLVNGFNTKSVTSIAVAAGVATATCATHGFMGTYGKLVLISGAPEALLNGRKQPGGITTNSFTFPAPGVADGTYTGTISAKRAPLGWVEAHSGTNVSIFARTALESTAPMLRVNDSFLAGSTATDARTLAVESATGVDTYANPAPTEAQISGGCFLHRGPNSATPKRWCVVGDERAVWVFTQYDSQSASSGYLAPFWFGDGVPYFPADSYFCVIAMAGSIGNGASSQSQAAAITSIRADVASSGLFASRLNTGIGGASRISICGLGSAAVGLLNGAQLSGNNIVISSPVYIMDSDGFKTLRGAVPGLAEPLASAPFSQFEIVENVAGSDRKFLAVRHSSQSSFGTLLIDLTGPWY